MKAKTTTTLVRCPTLDQCSQLENASEKRIKKALKALFDTGFSNLEKAVSPKIN